MAASDPDLIDSAAITYGDQVGQGGFAVVYKVRYNSPDGPIDAAAKVIDTTVVNELKFLSKLKHKNIIKYFGYLKDFVSTTLITEFAEK